jgi:hypothetical protein
VPDRNDGFLVPLNLHSLSPLHRVLGTPFSILIKCELIAKRFSYEFLIGETTFGQSSHLCGAQVLVNYNCWFCCTPNPFDPTV